MRFDCWLSGFTSMLSIAPTLITPGMRATASLISPNSRRRFVESQRSVGIVIQSIPAGADPNPGSDGRASLKTSEKQQCLE